MTAPTEAAARAMGAPDLKPCAFCGGKGHYTMGRFERHVEGWRVECEQRFTTCPMNARTHHHENIEDAGTAWNTRRPAP